MAPTCRRLTAALCCGSAAVIFLALAMLSTGSSEVESYVASAEVPVSAFSDQEPITPVPPAPTADPLKLALGKRLFEDPRLSGDGMRACISCHDTRTNGAGRSAHEAGVDGSELPLNTLTVFNAALSFRLGWEGKYRTLEAQAEWSLEGPAMGIHVEDVVARLRADTKLAERFRAAYRRDADRESLLDAIATYERSLVTTGSRFDRWLSGDPEALSAEEREGYRLFEALGCVSCHQGVNIGGNLFERHGIFRPLASPTPEILRVPSLRNVATTAPYFHDGSAATLQDAVRKMGAAQLDVRLSDDQVAMIVAFLGTLTGAGVAPP